MIAILGFIYSIPVWQFFSLNNKIKWLSIKLYNILTYLGKSVSVGFSDERQIGRSALVIWANNWLIIHQTWSHLLKCRRVFSVSPRMMVHYILIVRNIHIADFVPSIYFHLEYLRWTMALGNNITTCVIIPERAKIIRRNIILDTIHAYIYNNI